jgi:hypothetical protein
VTKSGAPLEGLVRPVFIQLPDPKAKVVDVAAGAKVVKLAAGAHFVDVVEVVGCHFATYEGHLYLFHFFRISSRKP